MCLFWVEIWAQVPSALIPLSPSYHSGILPQEAAPPIPPPPCTPIDAPSSVSSILRGPSLLPPLRTILFLLLSYVTRKWPCALTRMFSRLTPLNSLLRLPAYHLEAQLLWNANPNPFSPLTWVILFKSLPRHMLWIMQPFCTWAVRPWLFSLSP